VLCKNIKIEFCVQVKNKPCVVNNVIMRLISWKLPHGSETDTKKINTVIRAMLPNEPPLLPMSHHCSQ
jgi:hypothetical protein